MPDVMCIGEYLVEFVSIQDNVSLPDASGFIKAPGGAPANVAVGLQRLGMSAGFIGKVGDDPFGEFLRQSLRQTGVDTSYVFADSRTRTTAVFVAVWDDGHKDLCFYRNPGADMMLAPEEITPEMFDEARAFHYGSIGFIAEPCATAQRKAVKMARERGLMISYDCNYRPTLWPSAQQAKEVIRDSFQYCHLAKISEEEWEVATGHQDLDAGIEAVLNKGTELLVISRGPKGALVTNGDYRISVPSWDVNVVETTGAGDGFLAAIITRLLPEREQRGSLAAVPEDVAEETLLFATAVGAMACQKPGAIPALPTKAEVDAFIKNRGAPSP